MFYLRVEKTAEEYKKLLKEMFSETNSLNQPVMKYLNEQVFINSIYIIKFK